MTLTPHRISLALAALERRARLTPQRSPTLRTFTWQAQPQPARSPQPS